MSTPQIVISSGEEDHHPIPPPNTPNVITSTDMSGMEHFKTYLRYQAFLEKESSDSEQPRANLLTVHQADHKKSGAAGGGGGGESKEMSFSAETQAKHQKGMEEELLQALVCPLIPCVTFRAQC